jgi:hypothetical protein
MAIRPVILAAFRYAVRLKAGGMHDRPITIASKNRVHGPILSLGA